MIILILQGFLINLVSSLIFSKRVRSNYVVLVFLTSMVVAIGLSYVDPYHLMSLVFYSLIVVQYMITKERGKSVRFNFAYRTLDTRLKKISIYAMLLTILYNEFLVLLGSLIKFF